MKATAFYNLEKLVTAVREGLTSFDSLTLDIFDTLLIRRTFDPDQVKRPVSQYIADEANSLGIHLSMRQIWDVRNRIENEHRLRNVAIHPDHEACYDDFMREALEEIFGDALPGDLFKRVADYEMSVEQSVCVPRSGFVQLLEELRVAGKRVILVSDIYLPSRMIKQLIGALGLSALVEDVVSSADTFQAKASGTAFPILASRFGLDPARWLHIGDNPISDGVRPGEYGITAMVLKDLSEKHRLSVSRTLHHKATGHFWRGRNLQQLIAPLEHENQARSPLYVDGYNYLGFVLGYFTLNLLENIRKQSIKRIYFLSREGWTLKQYWDTAVPVLAPNTHLPETSYLYVSRIALAKAACANSGLSHLSASAALLPGTNRDFRDVCRVFSLNIEPLREHLNRFELRDDDPIGPMSPGVTPQLRRRFSEMLDDPDFRLSIRVQAEPARDLLIQYLRQEGFFDHRDVALVDIGWLGTIQHYLSEAIEGISERPRLHGYLLAATRLMPYRNDINSRLEGVLHDFHRFDFSESLITIVKDLFEESCRAPHPSVIGYQEGSDNRVTPLLRDTNDPAGKAEEQQSLYYQDLRQGIFDSAPRFATAVRLMNYVSGDLRPWLNFLLINRIAFPRTTEIKRIRHQSHQDDFAGTHKVLRKTRIKNRTLWNRSLTVLRLVPFIRLRYYLRHALLLLRES